MFTFGLCYPAGMLTVQKQPTKNVKEVVCAVQRLNRSDVDALTLDPVTGNKEEMLMCRRTSSSWAVGPGSSI